MDRSFDFEDDETLLEELAVKQINFHQADWLEKEEFAEVAIGDVVGHVDVYVAEGVDIGDDCNQYRLGRLLGATLGSNRVHGIPVCMEGGVIGIGYSKHVVEFAEP